MINLYDLYSLQIVHDYMGKESEFLTDWVAPLEHWHGRMGVIVGDVRRELDLLHYWQYRLASGKDDADEAEAAWQGEH